MSKVSLPSIVFGTSSLGNLYKALSFETKCAIVEQCFEHANRPVVFDSAGKYGAGLALESLGACLTQLNVDPNDVIISNKLGWLRVPLETPEPQFEPGVWKDLKYDAVQRISYQGILDCFHQGNDLLGKYQAQMVSVHDPDEYLAAATSESDKKARYRDILESYTALYELKSQGQVSSVGIGAKDWRVIRDLYSDVKLDWVMIANSLTIHSHSQELLNWLEQLKDDGVTVINSAVFNGGFLIGSSYYNYREVSPVTDADLYDWRDGFYRICNEFNLAPAQASAVFASKGPGVHAIALSTTNPERVKSNVALVNTMIPHAFWETLAAQGYIDKNYLKYCLI